MARRTRGDAKTLNDPDRIVGAPLEPIGTVERELTRPDGSKVVVEVPVYPPFRLPERKPARPAAPGRPRGATPRRRETRSGGAKGRG